MNLKKQSFTIGHSNHSIERFIELLKLHNITIDPLFVDRLEKGYPPPSSCLVTLSLSMPHIPWEGWEGGESCWKLITAVIDLN